MLINWFAESRAVLSQLQFSWVLEIMVAQYGHLFALTLLVFHKHIQKVISNAEMIPWPYQQYNQTPFARFQKFQLGHLLIKF